MALGPFGIEKALHILGENADVGVKLLFGAGAPGGDADIQDAAEQGSMYLDTGGNQYIKKTSGSGTDKWKRLADGDDLIHQRQVYKNPPPCGNRSTRNSFSPSCGNYRDTCLCGNL